MSRNLTSDGCSSGEHVPVCQCDVCLLRSELAESRSMHQDTLRAFEKYEQTSRAEHAAALGLATARIRELEGERARRLGNIRELCEAAEARERELEGERDELLGLVAGARWTDPNTGAEVRVGDTWKAKGAASTIAASVNYEVLALKRRRDGTTWAHVITPSEFATTIPAGALVNRFAIVARIEKVTKGTT